MRSFVLFLCLLVSASAYRVDADIQTCYWFDSDSHNIVSTSDFNVSWIDASGLGDGLHWFHAFVRDTDGKPSPVKSVCFYKNLSLADGTLYLSVDGRAYVTEEMADGYANMILDLSADEISYGLHSLGVYYTTPDGVITPMHETFFVKTPTSADIEELTGYFIVDGVKQFCASGRCSENVMHADIDMSEIADGLHMVDFFLADKSGIATKTCTAMFIKSPQGGSKLTGYNYWVNDHLEDQTEVVLDPPVTTCSIMRLLQLPSYPLKSASFNLDKDKDGRFFVHPVNTLNFLVKENTSYSILKNVPYVDTSVSHVISPLKFLVSGVKEDLGVIAENEIRWFQVRAEFGDSLVFNLDRAAIIQVFSPEGKEVFKSQGVMSMQKKGCHALCDGDYLVAVHDQQSDNKHGVNLMYERYNRYTLISHSPKVSANTGIVNMDLYGNGLDALKKVVLRHDTIDLESDSIVIVSGGYAVAQFNFLDKAHLPICAYDLQLTFDTDDPDKQDFRVKDALALELPDYGPIKTDLDYNVFIDGNTPHKIRVNVTNTGNVGCALIPLNLAVCSPSINKLEFNNFDVGYTTQFGLDSIPFSVNVDDVAGVGMKGDFIPLVLPYLGPKASTMLELSLWFEENSWSSDKWGFYAWPGRPWSWTLDPHLNHQPLRSGIKLDPAVNYSDMDCGEDSNIEDIYDTIDDLDVNVWNKFLAKLSIATAEVFAGIIISGTKIRDDAYAKDRSNPMGHDISEYTWKYRYNTLRSPAEIGYDLAMTFVPDKIKAPYQLYREMRERALRDCPSPAGYRLSHIPLSWDPNDILGFTNVSGSSFIGKNDRELGYVIEFENDSTLATMPANEIILCSRLDPQVFDLTSFHPDAVRFGKHKLDLDGEAEFFRTIDLRPSINALAEISHSLDYDTGESKWVIRAVDPLSLEPLRGEMYGLLPVNNTDGDGQGNVSYHISLKNDIEDGSVVANSASIVFDNNPPINTQEWINITDYVDPISCIVEAENYSKHEIKIRWLGTDARSGIWKYALYQQAGEDALWELVDDDITDSEIILDVQPDVDYGFFVVATDMAGNREEKSFKRELSYKDGVFTVSIDAVEFSTEWNTEGTLYDMLGRRVDGTPSPGIYISNGKKVLMLR